MEAGVCGKKMKGAGSNGGVLVVWFGGGGIGMVW